MNALILGHIGKILFGLDCIFCFGFDRLFFSFDRLFFSFDRLFSGLHRRFLNGLDFYFFLSLGFFGAFTRLLGFCFFCHDFLFQIQ